MIEDYTVGYVLEAGSNVIDNDSLMVCHSAHVQLAVLIPVAAALIFGIACHPSALAVGLLICFAAATRCSFSS